MERATGGQGRGLGARAEPTPGRRSPERQCVCSRNQESGARLSEALNHACLARIVPLRGAGRISALTHSPSCQGMTAICASPPSTASSLRGSSLPQRPYNRARSFSPRVRRGDRVREESDSASSAKGFRPEAINRIQFYGKPPTAGVV
jgi:hypothetical protein